MVSEYEARKLKQDLNATPASVWRCAAGLLGLVILVVMGTGSDLPHGGYNGTYTARESVQQQESTASHSEEAGKRLVSQGQ